MANAASAQVSSQVSSHNIEGTVVVSVACTHKNASILAPFTLHVDKAIKCWNRLYPSAKLDPTDAKSMMKVVKNPSNEDKQKFSIISGTTFGSSFVGMVHVLNNTSTKVSDSLAASEASLSASMDLGSFFAKKEGKMGVDSKMAADIKNLFSQQNVSSHVTLISMGVIPSIKSNEVAKSVEKFVNFDPKSNMEQVISIQSATADEQASVSSQAEVARTGEQSTEVQGKKMESALSALALVDETKNKMLDIDSMMTALEDYLDKAQNGDSGVPINYYLKDIDIKMLAEMWIAKYYPGKYMAIKYDDSDGAGPATADGGEKAKL